MNDSMYKRQSGRLKLATLAVTIAIPLAVGAASALLSMEGMKHFSTLSQPPLSPPAWLFPVAWTLLYILMGIASYRVYESGAGTAERSAALRAYGLQLGFNFLWSILFFNLDLYVLSFVWLLALLAIVIVTAVRFWRIDRPSAYLMLPYIAWLIFAAYLCLGVAILN